MRTAIVAVAACAVLATGCSRSPKPTAVVPPPDTARPAVPAPAPDTAKAAVRKPNSGGATNGTKPSREVATFPGTVAGSSTSAPAVVPKLSAAEEEKLVKETGAAVDQAQKALDAVDATKLDAERNRKYVIAKDFLAQATEARARHEYERAQGLAVKAKLLAEEIAK